jgi:hypothetical protein
LGDNLEISNFIEMDIETKEKHILDIARLAISTGEMKIIDQEVIIFFYQGC